MKKFIFVVFFVVVVAFLAFNNKAMAQIRREYDFPLPPPPVEKNGKWERPTPPPARPAPPPAPRYQTPPPPPPQYNYYPRYYGNGYYGGGYYGGGYYAQPRVYINAGRYGGNVGISGRGFSFNFSF